MVEKELVTTKKRLTASVLNQMFTPTLEEMRYIKCLGIVNIKSSKLLLVTKAMNTEFYLLVGRNMEEEKYIGKE